MLIMQHISLLSNNFLIMASLNLKYIFINTKKKEIVSKVQFLKKFRKLGLPFILNGKFLILIKITGLPIITINILFNL